ncbi:MAG: hypothetical protein JST27_11765 [Bacteroidetes bacterium]|nr:hypothetical protein [Bacteroidota bacterium]
MKRLLFWVLLLQPLCLFAQQKTDSALYVMPELNKGVLYAHDSALPLRSPLEIEWNQQNPDTSGILHEKLTAGFYETSKQAGIYAFYKPELKGKVLRVRNLNNDSLVFVKVIGALPQTKAFKGCNLGLSNEAKEALGVHERKAYCEVSYSE